MAIKIFEITHVVYTHSPFVIMCVVHICSHVQKHAALQ